MPTKFRGQTKIVGSMIRGWLLNVDQPQEPVGFNLRVDGRLRGVFVAQRPKAVLMRNMPDVEMAFSLEVRIVPEWITGGIQEIRFEDPGDEELNLVLRGSLGPTLGTTFAPDQIGGEAVMGAVETAHSPAKKPIGVAEAEAEGRWLDACRLWFAACREHPEDDVSVYNLLLCARRVSEGVESMEQLNDALSAWNFVSEADPNCEEARVATRWCQMSRGREAELAGEPIAARAYWSVALGLAPKDARAQKALRRLDEAMSDATIAAPESGVRYRGQVKIVGDAIRGWLLDLARPQEPIAFNLRIDGQLRGLYVARRFRPVMMHVMPDVETAFGFEIPIALHWITGGTQEVRLEDPRDQELDVVLRGALGPAQGVTFTRDQVGGEALIGAVNALAIRQVLKPARVAEAEAEGRWLDAFRLWFEVSQEHPGDDRYLYHLEQCGRLASERADSVPKIKEVLQAWHCLSEVDPDSEAARLGILWCHMTLADEAERASNLTTGQAHWNAVLDLSSADASAQRALQRFDRVVKADGAEAGSDKYRGQLKIAGDMLRGWLLNREDPEKPVRFNLRIDGQLRGLFIAERAKGVLVRGMPDVDTGFGFQIPILQEWITGGVQEICLEDPGDKGLSLVLRASLGPCAGEHFLADQLGGEAILGAVSAQVAMNSPAARHSDIGSMLGAALGYFQEGRFEAGLRALKAAFRLHSGTDSARREMASALGRLAKEKVSPEVRRKLILEQIELYRALTESRDRSVQINAQINLATAMLNIGQYEEAAKAADFALKWVPNSVRALVAKAKALVPQNAIAEACALYERVVEIEPHNQSIRTTLRILTALAQEDSPGAELPSVAMLKCGEPLNRALGFQYAPKSEIAPSNWICTLGSEESFLAGDLELLTTNGARHAGFMSLSGANGLVKEFWRREAVLGLIESGLLTGDGGAAALEEFKSFYADKAESIARGTSPAVVITSRNGGFRFGGGEHFLESAAEHYAEQGYAPIIVGTRPEFLGRESASGGLRYVFIEEGVAAFRRFVMKNNVALVHAISGMGFVVAEALKFTNIPFIYGVHFWRELLGDSQDSAYFDTETGRPIPRKEFRVVLSRAAAIYANSRYTQKTIEESFGVRCPIAYSVPREIHLS